jgi:uncharacterized protein YcfL
MKHIQILFLVLLLFAGCAGNRYALMNKGDSRHFLENIILRESKTKHISKKPILVIDGKPRRYNVELKNKKLEMYRYEIRNIDVLKLKTAVAIYGKEGEKGVLIISSIYDGKNASRNPLWLVDGKVWSKEELDTLNPKRIETVDIIKNKKDEAKYTDDSGRGVILIKLKY